MRSCKRPPPVAERCSRDPRLLWGHCTSAPSSTNFLVSQSAPGVKCVIHFWPRSRFHNETVSFPQLNFVNCKQNILQRWRFSVQFVIFYYYICFITQRKLMRLCWCGTGRGSRGHSRTYSWWVFPCCVFVLTSVFLARVYVSICCVFPQCYFWSVLWLIVTFNTNK